MAVDRQLVARTVGELPATLPQAGDLLVGLGRVVEATRTVVGVDGTGLTLAHEDGRPRWVAVSDAAMELLEQIQHDVGEGPCLAAFAEDRVVAVEDLRSERVWDRLAAVAGQLRVRGVLSVPVRLAGQSGLDRAGQGRAGRHHLGGEPGCGVPAAAHAGEVVVAQAGRPGPGGHAGGPA
jgi:GAF domain-containing protein